MINGTDTFSGEVPTVAAMSRRLHPDDPQRGVLEPTPVCIGRDAGHTLGPTYRDRQPLTLIHTYGTFRDPK